MVNMGEVFANSRLREADMDRVPLEGAERSRFLLRPGDLLFARQSLVLAGAGKCVVFVGDTEPVTFESHVIRVRLEPTIADPLFYFYFFQSSAGRAVIESIVEQGAGASGIRASDLARVKVPHPAIEEQRRIAVILGTLDDKIELNRRMAETLEGAAQALFKSWFRDSDSDARAQDALLADAVDLLRNKVDPQLEQDTVFQHYSLPAYDAGREAISEAGAGIRSSKFAVPRGAILLSKLNPEIERVWLPDIGPDDRAICSTEFLVLQPRAGVARTFVYEFLRSAPFRGMLTSLVTGTTGSHQRAHADAILRVPMPLPGPVQAAKFEQVVGPMLDRVAAGRRQSRALIELRDALLPRLLTGPLWA
jgi:type I restriction enzyme S subunit